MQSVSQLSCPSCGMFIAATDINVATDLARCAHCGAIHQLSAIVKAPSAAPVGDRPPAGSSLTVERTLEGTTITLPKTGFRPYHLFLLGFGIFWVGFVCVWTVFASMGSPLFALFSIPFWIVGIAMLRGVIVSSTETQAVSIDRTNLTFTRSHALGSKTRQFPLSDIQDFRLAPLNTKALTSLSRPGLAFRTRSPLAIASLLPAFATGEGLHYFFEHANEIEQEWVVKFLESRRKR